MSTTKKSFTVLLLLAAKFSFCQHNTVLRLFAGASVPIGAFATKTYDNAMPPSLAGTGFFVEAEVINNKGGSHFKPAAMLGLDINFYKMNTILNNYRAAKPGFNWSGTHGNWMAISLMPGLHYSAATSGKTIFNAGLFTGIAAVQVPGFTLSGVINQTGYTGGASGRQGSKWALAVCSRLKAGVQFKAGKRTRLEVETGVIYVKPTFKEVVSTYNETYKQDGSNFEQINISQYRSTFTQTVINLHAGVGVVVDL